ncbi:hypothetical protein AKI39_10595 [Bordetella sp. H567]|uniref:sulfatase-like hydrolase/transferase n=1 Tax=Bordetella sp. H567 TaxID=1697043 RepID=UPI00081CB4BE|nr:sulfatase-like hydrolase/transferase [Bordetella sp. H567]AOB31047.1 hypothetical protein AKI39_10595 [Bordetella sp. H567]
MPGPAPTVSSSSYRPAPASSRAVSASVPSLAARLVPECLTLVYVAWVFLAMDGFFAVERFHAIGLNVQGHFGPAEYLRQAVFVLEYAVAILVLYSATRVRRWAGAILLAVLWSLTTVDLTAHAIYGRPAGIGNISALNASAAMLDAALREYGQTIAVATGKAAVLFVPLIARALFSRRTRRPLWLPMLLICALAGMYGIILVKRGPPALIGFPKGYSYGFGSLAIEANNLLERPRYVPAQAEITSDVPATQPSPSTDTASATDAAGFGNFRNVIVIVDESIEYRHFYKLFQGQDTRYADFGQAYSGANCSAASNYILRKGWWPRQDTGHVGITRTDSLFTLARRRGYTTTYIDNQGVLDDPTTRNYIDGKELADIDHVVENRGPLYQRDAVALRQIAERAATGHNFIFVNKDGAHFPYRDYIDPSLASGDKATDYLTAIRTNTVDFLLALQARLPEGTLVFYTSDHGQNLTTRATHCNTGDEATPEEYRVPFLALATEPGVQARLKHAADVQRGRLTHLEFSESVREALGYRVPGVKSLFAPHPIETPFCGLYGSPKVFFGVEPSFKALPTH